MAVPAVLLILTSGAAAMTGGPKITVPAIVDGRTPAIAAEPGGGFAVAWNAFEEGGWGSDIYMRMFDAGGGALTGVIRVNLTTDGNQSEPAIAVESGGGVTVTWTSEGQDGSGLGVYARRFDSGGTPLSGEMAVNATTLEHQLEPAIAADSGGGFTVAWASGSADAPAGWDVFTRRFDAAGNPLSGEIAVNTTTAGDQERPAIAPDGSGGFAVAWESREADGQPAVFVRRFDSSGIPSGVEAAVDAAAATRQAFPAIVADGSAGFLVAWETREGAWFRRLDAAGSPLGSAARVDPGFFYAGRPTVAVAADGRFAVAWQGREEQQESEQVFARRFDAAGTPLSVAVRVDPAPGLEGSLELPSIAADVSGGFEVAWQWFEEGERNVFARHFASRPETRFDQGPLDPTNDATPTFAFSADEYGSTFECRLDDDGFAPCGSPLTTGPLPDGPHSFEARATNPDGVSDLTPAARGFTLDTVVPGTSLDSGPPALSSDSTPTFSFSSDDQTATFECRLDSAKYLPCGSPLPAGPLSDGLHSFQVRARDAAGNVDASPGEASFTIDTQPPSISIELAPEEGLGAGDPTPTFVLATSEEGTSFECRLDDGPASPCGSPFTTPPLADGPHDLSVRGTDQAGNTTLAERSFTVDTSAPDTSIDSGPAGPTNDATPTFAFSADEYGSTFECRLDGGGFAPCGSPLTAGPLPDGPHSFEARAVDDASNADPSPAARDFTVDTAAPDTSIDSGPGGLTNDPTPTFAFSSGERRGAGFECSVDGARFSACGSPLSTESLADGPHSFEVRATDAASNSDPTPAARGFTVDTAPPLLKIGRPSFSDGGRRIAVSLSCAEHCDVVAAGRIVGPRRFKAALGSVSRQLDPGRRATLGLRPKAARAQRRLRRFLRHGGRARAEMRIKATDAAGNSGTTRLTVGLRAGA
jgi:hypothetical protein